MDTTQQSLVKSERAPVSIGARGVQFQTLDDLWRFAQYISKSNFAPKGMESPEAIVVAMEMGLEIGLTPMASIQNIAVINGRPAVWGDVPLAIARNSGQLEIFTEWYEHDGKRTERNPAALNDSTTACCQIKRSGFAIATQTFSVADAKRAGLWGKAGPWTQYPLRMLQMRARAFALRDQFGDALKGLLTREEAEDIDPVKKAKDVTPRAEVIPANVSEIPKSSPSAEEDDIRMDFPATSEPAAATVRQTDAAHQQPAEAAVSVEVTNHRKVEIIVTNLGITLDQLNKWGTELGELTQEAASFGELPAAFVNKWAPRERAFVRALGVIKGGAK